MQELFRILHGKVETESNGTLRDYNMGIGKGEILYIQGLRESGIRVLPELFSGGRQLQEGTIYLREQRCPVLTKELALDMGIYTITAEADLVKSLSVAENLENIRWVRHPMQFYSKKAIEKKVSAYLNQEGIALECDIPLEDLSSSECQILSLLKAKMHGASLIVLDCTKGEYEGRKAEKLSEQIRKLSREGIAFIILSESYYPLADIADRIQMMHRGRDLMEWRGMTEQLKKDLINPAAMNSVSETGKDYLKNMLYGIYDYEWEPERGFLTYLKYFEEESPDLWREAAGMDCIPEKCGMQGKLVIIPREYMDAHFDSMNIQDNIIMTLSGRVSRSRYGFINRKFRTMISGEFYKLAGVPENTEYIGELNRVQKRILTFFRWEAAKPKTMILDNPYTGMSQEEAAQVRLYLEHLVSRGIRVVYFLQSLEELKEDCKVIFRSQDGHGFSRIEIKGENKTP